MYIIRNFFLFLSLSLTSQLLILQFISWKGEEEEEKGKWEGTKRREEEKKFSSHLFTSFTVDKKEFIGFLVVMNFPTPSQLLHHHPLSSLSLSLSPYFPSANNNNRLSLKKFFFLLNRVQKYFLA
mgnify:CR=1 FL=1